MNCNQSIKGKAFQLIYGLFIMLSIFSVSGYIGSSPVHLQKNQTELRHIPSAKPVAHTIHYNNPWYKSVLSKSVSNIRNSYAEVLSAYANLTNLKHFLQLHIFSDIKQNFINQFYPDIFFDNSYELHISLN